MRRYFIAFMLFLASGNALFSQDMNKIDLGGNWKFRKAGSQKWMKAKVPGVVHLDLLRNDIITDPFNRENESLQQWISETGWEYEKSFFISDTLFARKSIDLVCKGLDTYANVFLNDSLIIVADNMFKTYYSQVKYRLKVGLNTIRIQFPSITEENKRRYKALPYPLPGDDKVMSRKAAYQFGWDWGPTFITSGIWQPIYLRYYDYVNVLGVEYIQRSLTDSVAKMTAEFTLNSSLGDSSTISITANGVTYATKKVELSKGVTVVRVDFDVVHPKRWWPIGYGEPYLYPFEHTVTFLKKIVGKGVTNIGLRTIELVQKPDVIGKSFYFKVNGVPIFMKGANYIPMDNFLPRVKDSTYMELISDVVKANMNMLRVWGGGIYENDTFYDLCDKSGILVWQDFMFACAMYPPGKEFMQNVQAEAIQQIVRLRNHPCIALWCGNNEIDEAWKNWGWAKGTESLESDTIRSEKTLTRADGTRYDTTITEVKRRFFTYSEADSVEIRNAYKITFEGILKNAVERFDTGTAYIPTSPMFGWGHAESLKEGDQHYWGVWHGKEPLSMYEKKVGRFVSEYGFQSFPDIYTINQFTTPPDRKLDSPVFRLHQKSPIGFERIQEYMLEDYKMPKDFISYGYVSQVLQAEAMKIAIEAHRRNKPITMGTLFWQLNDCWPVVSWSVIDYYGRKKAAYYALKTEYAQKLVSPVIEDGKVKVYVISDDLKPQDLTLSIEMLDFSGNTIWNRVFPVTIKANSSEVHFDTSLMAVTTSRNVNEMLMLVHLVDGERIISKNILYFDKPKNLALKTPTIEKNILEIPEGYRLDLSTNTLAKDVAISCPYKGELSDNYFDLVPGRPKTIIFRTKTRNQNMINWLKLTHLQESYTETK